MKLKFHRKKLKNGITVLFEKRNLPIVSLSITNKFGAACEQSKIKGIAHVIEHMLFKGTKTKTQEQISKEIERRGGILNAYTAHEITSFWFKLPSEHIMSGLKILTDIIKNPDFDPGQFEDEKKVILEEIKMYNDNPQTAVMEQIEKNLYKPPFGNLIIGNKKTVSSLKRNFVKNYFEKMYNPKNYIITMVGKANLKKICDYLEREFSSKKQSPKIIKIEKKNSQTIQYRKDIDQASFVFGIHAPLPSSKDYPAIEILNAHLADGMSSRLFLEIREKRGLAYAVKGIIESEKNYSRYIIYVGTTKEAIPEVEKIILQEFKKIEKMTKKELEQAKQRVIGLHKILSEESTDVMNNLIFAELAGKAEDYYKFERKVKSIMLEQVKKLARFKNYSTAAIVPK